MHLPIRNRCVAIAALFVCLVLAPYEAWGKGKGGGGKGGRGGKSQAGFKSSKHGGGGRSAHDAFSGRRPTPHLDQQSLGGRGRASRANDLRERITHGGSRWTSDGSGGSAHPWSMQRANEDRKLNQRLGVADKLDQLAERTGNTNLHDTAARQREKAWEHYEKRLAKINSKDPTYEPPIDDDPTGEEGAFLDDSALLEDALTEVPPPSSGTPTPATPPAEVTDPVTNPLESVQRLTGRENALYRQLRNEQRKLTSQMEAAERLWDAFEQTGDEALAEAARAFEERALAQFDKRIEAISDFQQRHGLSDQVGQVLQEIEEIGRGSSEVSVLTNPQP